MVVWLWEEFLIEIKLSEENDCGGIIIRSKFGFNYYLNATNLHYASHRSPWKGISQTLPLFLPHTKLSLRCGNRIRFGFEPWINFFALLPVTLVSSIFLLSKPISSLVY